MSMLTQRFNKINFFSLNIYQNFLRNISICKDLSNFDGFSFDDSMEQRIPLWRFRQANGISSRWNYINPLL